MGCGVCSASTVQKSTNQTAKIQRKTTVWRLIWCRVKTICYKTVIKRFQCASFHGIFSCYSLAAHFLTLHFYFSHSKRIRILCNMQYHLKRKGTCSWECLLFLSLCDLSEVFQEKYTHTLRFFSVECTPHYSVNICTGFSWNSSVQRKLNWLAIFEILNFFVRLPSLQRMNMFDWNIWSSSLSLTKTDYFTCLCFLFPRKHLFDLLIQWNLVFTVHISVLTQFNEIFQSNPFTYSC